MILRFRQCIRKMACSKYEYVKNFELDDRILPNIWIVVRVDGKGFHKFSKTHNFEKPNDDRGWLQTRLIPMAHDRQTPPFQPCTS